jgi:hypothetical protein
MARSVLQRAGMVLDGLAGLRDLGGSRPLPPSPPPMASVFTPPPGAETEEAQRVREAAEEAHRVGNPRNTMCSCGCMRWESSRASDGALIWLCAGCRGRFTPRDPSLAVVRPSPPAPPPPAPLPTAEEARAALAAAVEARERARAAHGKVSSDAALAARNASDAQARVEAAEAALAEARVQARSAAVAALQAGRTAAASDLSKVRGEVEKASDGLLAARGALEEIEAKQDGARKALASSQAKTDGAALVVVAAELGPPSVVRAQELAGELTKALARLGWLSGRRAYWSPEVQALLALQGLPVRDWPQTNKLATESDAALERALVALANDPTTEIPAS